MLSDGRRSGREQVNRRRRIANALLPLDHAIDEKTRGSVAFRPQRTRSHDVDKSVSPFCPATAERCDPQRSAAARQPAGYSRNSSTKDRRNQRFAGS